jgi:phosphoserine phosphatase
VSDQQILPSWRAGATRSALLSFLDAAGELPVEQRVAVFDNDGTLWSEKPHYTQMYFFMYELKAAVASQPQLGEREEYRAILQQDMAALGEMGLQRVAAALLELFESMEPSEFDDRVREFFANSSHPDRGVSFERLRYSPMLELIDELRTRQFSVYLVTGGGTEFVRAISAQFYGVAPEGVVGSEMVYSFVRDGAKVTLSRTAQILGAANEGETKVSNIQRQLGRQPIFAAGNSPGDTEMLEYAVSFDGPSLGLLIDHDDADREYSYESIAATFDSDEPLSETARRLGWTTVSMKNDWSEVFPER